MAPNATTKKANYTITTSDFMVRMDATTLAVTVMLPDASACYANGIGQCFAIKKVDASANVVTLQAQGTQKIDMFSTYQITQQYSCICLISNGSGWDIYAGF